MNKLREKFKNAFPYSPSSHFDECEQITDDFTVKLLIWMVNIKPNNENLKHIDFEKGDEYVAKELQQYFKDNIYEA